jgi:putative endonuclease
MPESGAAEGASSPTDRTRRWSVYMLRCGDGSLYTGIAMDVSRRIAEHEDGTRGARYLRGRGPLVLVFQSEVGDRSLATRAEVRIKRLGRRAKEEFIASPRGIGRLLDDLLATDDARMSAGAP